MPQKPTHGDIDILVCPPLFGSLPSISDTLSSHLGAVCSKRVNRRFSFAIPFPSTSTTPDSEPQYFKVFIRDTCPELFPWKVLIHSYGDLWNIVGACAARYGLAVNDNGLNLKMRFIANESRRFPLLFLSRDVGLIFGFLGLDKQVYDAGFQTTEQAFEWVVRGRFFRRGMFGCNWSVAEKERKSKEKTEMYREFVEEWLPSQDYLLGGRGKRPKENSRKVREEALDKFGKREQYERKLDSFRRSILADGMWRRIANEIPIEGKELEEVMAGLRKRLRWGIEEVASQGEEGEVVEMIEKIDEEMVEGTVEWVVEYWGEILGCQIGLG